MPRPGSHCDAGGQLLSLEYSNALDHFGYGENHSTWQCQGAVYEDSGAQRGSVASLCVGLLLDVYSAGEAEP